MNLMNNPQEIPTTDITYYDLEFLKETFGDDAEIMCSMLEAFSKEAELAIEQMQFHTQSQNTEGLRSTAHRLKSNLEMLNAHVLKEMAINIEFDAKSGEATQELLQNAQVFNDGLNQMLMKVKDQMEGLTLENHF